MIYSFRKYIRSSIIQINKENNMNEKISIIVPIYNSEKTIESCVSSLVQQSYNNIEIILVNDGSQDQSLQICKEFARKDSRIVVIDKKNGGVSSARNIGIIKASGDFLMFCDSDDWVKEDYCKDMIQYHSDNHLLMCEIETKVINTKKIINQDVNQKINIEEISKSKFLEFKDRGLGSPTNKIFKKRIVTDNKIFFPETLFLGEDFAFVISYLKSIPGNIRYLHKKLYVYQIENVESLSKKTPSCRQNEQFYNILTDAIISFNAQNEETYQLRNKIIMYDFEKILISLVQKKSLSFIKKCRMARMVMQTRAYQSCCWTGTGSSNLLYEWLYKTKKAKLLMLFLYFMKRSR